MGEAGRKYESTFALARTSRWGPTSNKSPTNLQQISNAHNHIITTALCYLIHQNSTDIRSLPYALSRNIIDMAATRLPDTEIVEDVYNHIALPAHLPTRQDSRIDKIEGAVFDRVLNASVKLSGLFPDDGSLISLYRSLKTSRRVNMSGRLSKASLLSAFKELKSTHFILIHVAEQNAALVLRRQER